MNSIVTRPSLRGDVEDLLQHVSREIILPRFQSLADKDVRTKNGPGDLVTVADEEAEQALGAGLVHLLPDSNVIGEEAAADNPDLLDHLLRPGAVWIIDPIDGTSNFVAGRENFGIIVALVADGETVMGWIHDPLNDRTLWAGRGEGAWIKKERLKIHNGPDRDISGMSAALYHRAFKPALDVFAHISRAGSAAHEYWAMAESRTQVTSFSRLNPWDHAAGILIHQEAGGYTAMLDGKPYHPAERKKRGLLSAPSKAVWQHVRALADDSKI